MILGVIPINLPSWAEKYKLGMTIADFNILDKRRENEKQSIIDGGYALREEMEENGEADRYEKMQLLRPNIDESFEGSHID